MLRLYRRTNVVFSGRADPTPDRPAPTAHPNSTRSPSQEPASKMDSAQAHHQARPQTLAKARPETSVSVRREVHVQTQTEAACSARGGSGDPCPPVRGAGVLQENARVVCNRDVLVGATIAGSRLTGNNTVFGGGSGAGTVARTLSTGRVGATTSSGEGHTGCSRAVTDPWARSDYKSREEAQLCEGSEPEEMPARSVGVDTGVREARDCSNSTWRPENAAVSSAAARSPDTQNKVGLGDTSDRLEMAVFNGEEQHRRKQSLRSTSEEVSDICGIVEACLNVGVSTPAQDLRRDVAVDPQNRRRRNEVEELFTASKHEAADDVARRSSSTPHVGSPDSAHFPTASSCVLRADLLTENNFETPHKTLDADPRESGAGDNKQDEERTAMTPRADKAIDVAHKEVEVRLRKAR